MRGRFVIALVVLSGACGTDSSPTPTAKESGSAAGPVGSPPVTTAPAPDAAPVVPDAAPVPPSDPFVGKWKAPKVTLSIRKAGAKYIVDAKNPEGMVNGTFAGAGSPDGIALGPPYGDMTYLADDGTLLWVGLTFRRTSKKSPGAAAAVDEPKRPSESNCRAAYANANALQDAWIAEAQARGSVGTELSWIERDIAAATERCVARDSIAKVGCLRKATDKASLLPCAGM